MIKSLLGLTVDLCEVVYYVIPAKPWQVRWWWLGVWIKVTKVYVYRGGRKIPLG